MARRAIRTTSRACPAARAAGPAAAVAYGLAPLALGSDTGGSVRQPAAFCGVVGLKPTYGRLSRYGLVAFGSSLDQVGIFGRDVADVALLYALLAGPDPLDATSRPGPAAGRERLGRAGWRACASAGPPTCGGRVWSDEVVAGLEEAAAWLERAGARRVPFDFLPGEYAVATYYLVATAEASSNLARFDGVRYGHRDRREPRPGRARTRAPAAPASVRRCSAASCSAPTRCRPGYRDEYYVTAQRARARIRREYEAAFARCDLLLMPVAPTLPFRLGEKLDDPLAMYLSDIFTLGANLAGMPGAERAGQRRRRRDCRGRVQLLGPDDGEARRCCAPRARWRCRAHGRGSNALTKWSSDGPRSGDRAGVPHPAAYPREDVLRLPGGVTALRPIRTSARCASACRVRSRERTTRWSRLALRLGLALGCAIREEQRLRAQALLLPG